MYKKKVVLTIDSGKEDREILKEYGRIELRQIRIQRIAQEAIEQDGILSQEDISKYLSCDVRTLRRDLRQIKGRGIEVITRGVLHNIGRGQTHKKKIVGLYLDGYFFTDIKLKTSHSVGAIKRYVQDFTKVMMSISRGIREGEEIRSVTGLSINLINQYKEILKESRGNKQRQEKLEMLREMHKGVKKTPKPTGYKADRMIGDYRWA
jgi:heme exporter protein D